MPELLGILLTIPIPLIIAEILKKKEEEPLGKFKGTITRVKVKINPKKRS